MTEQESMKEIERLSNKNKFFQKENEILDDANRDLQREIERLNKDNNYLHTEVECLNKELDKVNGELKESRIKCGSMQNIVAQITKGGTVVKDDNPLLEELKSKDSIIKDLQQELSTAKSAIQEAEELRTINEDLKNKLSILTEGHSWQSAVDTRVLKKYEIMAKVLCFNVNGCSTSDIMEKLYQEGIDVCQKTIYRALSVKANEDRERIEKVLFFCKEIFKANQVSDDAVLQWFSETRIKKLHLVSQEDLVEQYGQEIIRNIEADKYVMGFYYNPQEVRRYLEGSTWGDTSL